MRVVRGWRRSSTEGSQRFCDSLPEAHAGPKTIIVKRVLAQFGHETGFQRFQIGPVDLL